MRRTLIIAECGINHNRSLDTAKQLADAAKECGADVFKTQLEYPTEYCLTYAETQALYEYCASIGMPFACTAFDVPSLEFLLANTRLEFVKIASSDEKNLPLLKAAAFSALPVIQSIKTGGMIYSFQWAALHVVAEYPTPLEHADLRRIRDDRRISGLSDHSGNPLIPALAVAMGAEIIEAHITLDRNQDGPDHKASLDVAGFKRMVQYLRMAEIACA